MSPDANDAIFVNLPSAAVAVMEPSVTARAVLSLVALTDSPLSIVTVPL